MSRFILYQGDCLDVLRTLDESSVDAIVTDPPYDLTAGKKGGTGTATLNPHSPAGRARIGTGGGFMGHEWDATGIAFDSETWEAALRVLKPGGYLLAFGGSRTVHRMACAIEDAGFEIRDRLRYECAVSTKYDGLWESLDPQQRAVLLDLLHDASPLAEMAWQYGSGFPKSVAFHRKMPADLAQVWATWGSALKPAYEPIIVARKPLAAPTLHANVERFGVGGLHIDACRVPIDPQADASQLRTMQRSVRNVGDGWGMSSVSGDKPQVVRPEGRWPANVLHDGSEAVLASYPQASGHIANAKVDPSGRKNQNVYGAMRRGRAGRSGERHADMGSAARFFYCAKASRRDRNEGTQVDGPPAVEYGATMRQRENADWTARNGNPHPTVKPTELMRYLCRLVTPRGGVVLDPFMGSGSTGKAAMLEGFRFIGIEREPQYVEIARRRITFALRQASATRSQSDLFNEEVEEVV
jgi:site-specific DNA-methyltransferase (adenine-specific)